MATDIDRPALDDILRFYAQSGLDYAVGEDAVDQFAAFSAVKPAAQPAPNVTIAAPKAAPIPSAARPAAIPDDAAIASAQALAASCHSIADLAGALAAFDGCGLKFTAKHLLFADGNAQAPVMFITDAPGREDDLEGRLCAGQTGVLFDRMLAAIGLDRRNAYLGAVIPWRPPGNRMPTAFEVEVCRPFILRHIELAAPRFLVFLGELPARTLIGSSESILRLRGQWRDYALPDGRMLPALSLMPPAYLIKQPGQKRLAWADLLSLKQRLRQAG